MFKFTTFQKSAFLACHAKEDKLRAKKRSNIICPSNIRFIIYIYGKAESIAEYDIPIFFDGEITKAPEQECVMVIDNKEYDCLLVQWETNETTTINNIKIPRHYGLLCLKDDENSLKYARQKSKEKTTYL